jgi:hypothetical protein
MKRLLLPRLLLLLHLLFLLLLLPANVHHPLTSIPNYQA